jgi:hypothetical protein
MPTPNHYTGPTGASPFRAYLSTPIASRAGEQSGPQRQRQPLVTTARTSLMKTNQNGGSGTEEVERLSRTADGSLARQDPTSLACEGVLNGWRRLICHEFVDRKTDTLNQGQHHTLQDGQHAVRLLEPTTQRWTRPSYPDSASLGSRDNTRTCCEAATSQEATCDTVPWILLLSHGDERAIKGCKESTPSGEGA